MVVRTKRLRDMSNFLSDSKTGDEDVEMEEPPRKIRRNIQGSFHEIKDRALFEKTISKKFLNFARSNKRTILNIETDNEFVNRFCNCQSSTFPYEEVEDQLEKEKKWTDEQLEEMFELRQQANHDFAFESIISHRFIMRDQDYKKFSEDKKMIIENVATLLEDMEKSDWNPEGHPFLHKYCVFMVQYGWGFHRGQLGFYPSSNFFELKMFNRRYRTVRPMLETVVEYLRRFVKTLQNEIKQNPPIPDKSLSTKQQTTNEQFQDMKEFEKKNNIRERWFELKRDGLYLYQSYHNDNESNRNKSKNTIVTKKNIIREIDKVNVLSPEEVEALHLPQELRKCYMLKITSNNNEREDICFVDSKSEVDLWIRKLSPFLKTL